MSLLTLEDAVKGFNDRELLNGVSLTLAEGERVGLLGRNGSGKSTLLRILAGLDTPESGSLTVRKGVRLGYLEQDPAVEPEKTLRQVVRSGLAGREQVLAQLEGVHAALASAQDKELKRLLRRQSSLEEQLEAVGGHDVEHRVESTLQNLGLTEFDRTCANLSGGEARRVALARLLLSKPDVLLLDEPTNHLDAFVTDWLEDWFLETRIPLLMVTHDRYFLDRVVDRIVELDRGELHSYEGGYDAYLHERAARLEVERKDEVSRLILLRRETAWIRRGPPARTTKSKSRIQRYDDLVDAAPITDAADLDFAIPKGPRLGDRVVKLTGISKAYDGRTIIPSIDLELGPGTRLGVVGPNGAGKSTLINMILGELAPDKGKREVGETVRFMGIDQGRRELDLDLTVEEVVAGKSDVVRTGDRVVKVKSFLDKFGFPVREQTKKISQLSGGERNRVLLAKLMCADGNVLVLDEPTNDLDLGTLRALEEALLVFPGSAVVVSHDRWFLDRVATQILYLDGEGGARLHHGDLSSLLDELAQARKSTARAKPKSKSKSKPAESAESAARSKGDPKPKRITPWQLKELDGLEGKIAGSEEVLAALDGRLADPSLYTSERSVVQALEQERKDRQAELDALYARWEELESLRG